jgi:DNA-binding HxlR family transcriptional regulator
MYFGKHTFKEFASSEEKITTSVLADRLSNLGRNGILAKQPHPTDGRRDIYTFTEKGLGLVPMLLDMMEWGTKHDPTSTGHRRKAFVSKIRKEHGSLSREVKSKLRRGNVAFT